MVHRAMTNDNLVVLIWYEVSGSGKKLSEAYVGCGRIFFSLRIMFLKDGKVVVLPKKGVYL